MESYDIVCIAQHSWHGVWARPQQLMSRFAREHRVLFVRPISVSHLLTNPAERNWKPFRWVESNVWVYSPPMLPFGRTLPVVRLLNEARIVRLVRRKIRQLGLRDFVLWFYAPMSRYLVGRLGEAAVVYDCADAWEQFETTQPFCVTRDRMLSVEADVLFAGAGKVYETRCDWNSNCHLFTGGVDYAHFAEPAPVLPEDMAGIPRPVIGYAGLIDDARMDCELLDRMASAHPEWSIVLVGPVQENVLMRNLRHPNVHFLGLKPYGELPRYIAAFDVAMAPYKVGEATHNINPTKLLEYMAAGKPVVSSALDEVKSCYLDRLSIAGDRDDFIRCVERVLAGETAVPIDGNRALAAERSWESVATRMLELVERQL